MRREASISESSEPGAAETAKGGRVDSLTSEPQGVVGVSVDAAGS